MLNIKMLAAGLMLTALVAIPAQAGGTVDLSLANTHFRLAFDATRVQSGIHLNAAWLHDEKDGEMGEAGFHVVETRPRNRNVFVGIGVKAHVAHLHRIEEDASAIGVGGFFRYGLAVNPAISFAGYGYFAPSVLSFSETENLINTDLRLQFSAIPSARLYVGYRYVGIKLEGMDKRYRLGDGVHVGVSLDF